MFETQKTNLLSDSQKAALLHIESCAENIHTLGKAELPNVLAMSNISRADFDQAEQQIKDHARIGLQFHPDRISKCGRTVVQALLEDGLYKNQFETHLSNGGLDPTPGGVRCAWEDRIFGESFLKNNAELSERPKYGGLHGPEPIFRLSKRMRNQGRKSERHKLFPAPGFIIRTK